MSFNNFARHATEQGWDAPSIGQQIANALDTIHQQNYKYNTLYNGIDPAKIPAEYTAHLLAGAHAELLQRFLDQGSPIAFEEAIVRLANSITWSI